MDKNNNMNECVMVHYTDYSDTNDAFIMTCDGCGLIRVSSWKKDNVATISDLSVNLEKRKQGIGNLLLREAEDIAKCNFKVDFVQLKVIHGSWKEKWYSRHGYKFISVDGDAKYVWMMKKIRNDEEDKI